MNGHAPLSFIASFLRSFWRGPSTQRGAPRAHQEWRQADIMARQAELRVEQAWAAHLSTGNGIPVSVMTEARALRMLATEKLAAWLLEEALGTRR